MMGGDGWGSGGGGGVPFFKLNFLFLDKVFTVTESSGRFIVCLSEVHQLFPTLYFI